MAWRYDEAHHTWWDDESTTYEPLNPTGPEHARANEPAEPPEVAPASGLTSLHELLLALEATLEALRKEFGPWGPVPVEEPPAPTVEDTQAFPAVPPEEPVEPEPLPVLMTSTDGGKHWAPVEASPSESAITPGTLSVPVVFGRAVTAGEQDHSNPWLFAGERALPPAAPVATP